MRWRGGRRGRGGRSRSIDEGVSLGGWVVGGGVVWRGYCSCANGSSWWILVDRSLAPGRAGLLRYDDWVKVQLVTSSNRGSSPRYPFPRLSKGVPVTLFPQNSSQFSSEGPLITSKEEMSLSNVVIATPRMKTNSGDASTQ